MFFGVNQPGTTFWQERQLPLGYTYMIGEHDFDIYFDGFACYNFQFFLTSQSLLLHIYGQNTPATAHTTQTQKNND